MFRPNPLPPRVLGLLVEIQHRRRIFVPIGRVTSIEAAAVVLASGSVNLRRFEQRPGEALVLGGLLDRTATIRETDARVTVIDAAMEQTRTKDWVLTRLAVRDLGPRLARRRGHVRQVEWEELEGLGPTPEAQQGADALLTVLATSRAADIANMLQDLDAKRRQEIAVALDDERLADVLEELPEDTQVKILASLADERAADILEKMDPDDAADLLAELARPGGDPRRGRAGAPTARAAPQPRPAPPPGPARGAAPGRPRAPPARAAGARRAAGAGGGAGRPAGSGAGGGPAHASPGAR